MYIFELIYMAKWPKNFHLESRLAHSYVRTEMKMACEGNGKSIKLRIRPGFESQSTWTRPSHLTGPQRSYLYDECW